MMVPASIMARRSGPMPLNGSFGFTPARYADASLQGPHHTAAMSMIIGVPAQSHRFFSSPKWLRAATCLTGEPTATVPQPGSTPQASPSPSPSPVSPSPSPVPSPSPSPGSPSPSPGSPSPGLLSLLSPGSPSPSPSPVSEVSEGMGSSLSH